MFDLTSIDPTLLDPTLNPWGIGAPGYDGASTGSLYSGIGGLHHRDVVCPVGGRVPVAVDPVLGHSAWVQCPRCSAMHRLQADDHEGGGDVEERPEAQWRHEQEQDDEGDRDEEEQHRVQGADGETVVM
jgi:hypothetical protein